MTKINNTLDAIHFLAYCFEQNQNNTIDYQVIDYAKDKLQTTKLRLYILHNDHLTDITRLVKMIIQDQNIVDYRSITIHPSNAKQFLEERLNQFNNQLNPPNIGKWHINLKEIDIA